MNLDLHAHNCSWGSLICWIRVSWYVYPRVKSLLRLAIHFSNFTFCGYFENVFAKHTTKYETLTVHFSYFMRISCSINATKKTTKSFDYLTFCANANPGVKCKKRKKGCEMGKKWREIPAIHFLFFAFHDRFCVFCDKGIFTRSYLWRSQVTETLTLYAHKWECLHVNDKWSPLKLVANHWFSVALPHRWLSDFLWRDNWLYIMIYVRIHTIDGSGRHKIRKYKKMYFIFSWTRSLM